MCLPSEVNGATIQILAASIGSLLCVNFGLVFGATPASARGRLYESEETPLNHRITDDRSITVWISSSLFLSAAVGSLVLGWAALKIGPKMVLQLCGLLQMTAWLSLHFAQSIGYIYGGQVLAGIAAGGSLTVLPIFISEISEHENCQILTAVSEVGRSFGILLGFTLAPYTQHQVVSIVGLCLSAVFNLLFPFVQESPFYFMHQRQARNMEKSLRWYRGIRDIATQQSPEFLRELAAFRREMKFQKLLNCDISQMHVLRVCAIALVLLVGANLSGTYVIFNYAGLGFSTAHDHLSSDGAMLILAGVQFLGSVIGLWTISQFDRKILFRLAAFVAAFALIALALVTTFAALLKASTVIDVSLGLLSVHVLATSLGFYPLATIIIGDFIPVELKLRSTVSSVLWSISWLLIFALIHCYHLAGLLSYYWLFACSCCVVALLSIFLLPETREKSLAEVQEQLDVLTLTNKKDIPTIKISLVMS